jgi:hypothetical protein
MLAFAFDCDAEHHKASGFIGDDFHRSNAVSEENPMVVVILPKAIFSGGLQVSRIEVEPQSIFFDTPLEHLLGHLIATMIIRKGTNALKFTIGYFNYIDRVQLDDPADMRFAVSTVVTRF